MRLAVDGNSCAARTLGSNRAVVDKLVSWGNCDVAPVRAEASRLVAVLLKGGLVSGGSGDTLEQRRRVATNAAASGALALVTATLVRICSRFFGGPYGNLML